MSNSSEKAALEAYPPTYSDGKRYAKRVQSESVDTHQSVRTIFRKGYELAEKDLALTWEDIRAIDELLTLVYSDNEKDYYQRVLEEFNKKREQR